MFYHWKSSSVFSQLRILDTHQYITQVPRITYPPQPFILFHIGDHFFIKSRGACVTISLKFNVGGPGAEPPGKFLQYYIGPKNVLPLEIFERVFIAQNP